MCVGLWRKMMIRCFCFISPSSRTAPTRSAAEEEKKAPIKKESARKEGGKSFFWRGGYVAGMISWVDRDWILLWGECSEWRPRRWYCSFWALGSIHSLPADPIVAQCERAEIEGGSFERAERNLRSKHDALFLEGSPRGSHKYTLSQTCKIMSNFKGREKKKC